MKSPVLLYFVCVLAGFALTKVSLTGTFLVGLTTILQIIGLLAIIIFSLVLLYIGVMALLKKEF